MTKESIVRLNKDWEDFKSLCGRVVCEKNKVKYATVSEVVIHGSHVRAWHGLRSTVISFDEITAMWDKENPKSGAELFWENYYTHGNGYKMPGPPSNFRFM